MGTLSAELAQGLSRHPALRAARVSGQDPIEVERGEAYVRVLSVDAISSDMSELLPWLDQGRGVLVLGVLEPKRLQALSGEVPVAVLPEDAPLEVIALAIDGVLERVELRKSAIARNHQLTRYEYERGELVEIARAITRERDIDRLLTRILEKSRYITGADAGSIYVLEGERERPGKPGTQKLRFKLSQNDSMVYESREFVMPVDTESIAGTAVVMRQSINIADVYAVDADESVPYGFDESFDARTGYRTVSMLAVPMISAEDEVIGLIQLINKKRNPRARLKTPQDVAREVIPFDARSEELLSALAAQAGIALENALLYDEIRNIFEGFVRASVQAIEQRDPTTSGHSQRVSLLSLELAKKVDHESHGPYASAHFELRELRELEYAALLHDFGKIGVREQVLVKAKKLYPYERDAIRARIDFAIKTAEVELLRTKLELIDRGAGKSDLDRAQERFEARKSELLDAWSVVERANEPTVLHEGDFTRLALVGDALYQDPSGAAQPLLTPTELVSLKIMRGSLSPSEIEEIRSHVVHTYNFLTKIPWGKSMQRIPQIAVAHHEKLNGLGYPYGTHAIEIPLLSKIMTVADIYDALTASDRPYKKAIERERALEILGYEVKDGHLDGELVRIFREAEVQRVLEASPVG